MGDPPAAAGQGRERRGRARELPAQPLSTVQPRALDRVLALWREAQIRLELAAPGSADAQAAADDIERLREEYHATTERKFADADVHDWRT